MNRKRSRLPDQKTAKLQREIYTSEEGQTAQADETGTNETNKKNGNFAFFFCRFCCQYLLLTFILRGPVVAGDAVAVATHIYNNIIYINITYR